MYVQGQKYFKLPLSTLSSSGDYECPMVINPLKKLSKLLATAYI